MYFLYRLTSLKYSASAGPTDLSMKSVGPNSSSSSSNSHGQGGGGGGASAQLSPPEVTAVRQLIAGYRESAAFLLRSADELENLILQQNWVRATPCQLPAPSSACPSRGRLSHTKTQLYTSDTAAHSGPCRYDTYPHMFMSLGGPEHITGWKMFIYAFGSLWPYSALLSVAIHPIQFILAPQPPFVSGSDDLCEKKNRKNRKNWCTDWGVESA